MRSLRFVWLDHNERLGGPVPASVAQLTQLGAFEIHKSNFSGTLPAMDFGGISDCHMEGNAFACPLPAGAASCGASCK